MSRVLGKCPSTPRPALADHSVKLLSATARTSSQGEASLPVAARQILTQVRWPDACRTIAGSRCHGHRRMRRCSQHRPRKRLAPGGCRSRLRPRPRSSGSGAGGEWRVPAAGGLRRAVPRVPWPIRETDRTRTGTGIDAPPTATPCTPPARQRRGRSARGACHSSDHLLATPTPRQARVRLRGSVRSVRPGAPSRCCRGEVRREASSPGRTR